MSLALVVEILPLTPLVLKQRELMERALGSMTGKQLTPQRRTLKKKKKERGKGRGRRAENSQVAGGLRLSAGTTCS